VRYTDPDGQITAEEQEAAMQEYLEKAWQNTTFGPDPDSFNDLNSISYRIKQFAENNLGQEYGNGNQCDDWVEKVLDQAGIDPSNFLAGKATSTNVQQHIDKVTRDGTNVTATQEGSYVVFMNEAKIGDYIPHAGILIIDKNGDHIFYQSSSGGSGLSKKENYGNISEFQGSYGYNKFYYQKIY